MVSWNYKPQVLQRRIFETRKLQPQEPLRIVRYTSEYRNWSTRERQREWETKRKGERDVATFTE